MKTTLADLMGYKIIKRIAKPEYQGRLWPDEQALIGIKGEVLGDIMIGPMPLGRFGWQLRPPAKIYDNLLCALLVMDESLRISQPIIIPNIITLNSLRNLMEAKFDDYDALNEVIRMIFEDILLSDAIAAFLGYKHRGTKSYHYFDNMCVEAWPGCCHSYYSKVKGPKILKSAKNIKALLKAGFKEFILSSIMLGSGLVLPSKAKALEGHIYDLFTEQAVKQARVQVVNPPADTLATTFTDSTGYYKLEKPILFASPSELDFGSSPTDTLKKIYIKNNGIGKLEWQLSDDKEWLSTKPDSGKTLAETDTIKVKISRAELDSGSYQGNIFVSSNDGEDTIKVAMEVVGIAEETGKQGLEKLVMNAYPNPSSAPIINFTLPRASKVSLDIYDVTGRKIRNLVDQYLDAGQYTYQWHADVSDGIYFPVLKTEKGSKTTKLVIMKGAGSSGSEGLVRKLNDNDKKGLSSRLFYLNNNEKLRSNNSLSSHLNENKKDKKDNNSLSQLLNNSSSSSSQLLSSLDTTYLQLIIKKEGYHQRQTWITRADTLRNETIIDTLPRQGFLDDVARSDCHNQACPYKITHRWLQQPKFYINLVNMGTGDTLSENDWRIKLVDSIIRSDLPKLTKIFGKDSSFVSEPLVTTGTDPPEYHTKGWIRLEYDDSISGGGAGIDYENEAIVGGVAFVNSTLSGYLIRHLWLHEFGHAFGMEHTPVLSDSSVMYHTAAYPWQEYMPSDLRAGKFLYNRPVGNQAPDKDPLPGTYGKKGKGSTTYSITYEDPFSF